MLRFRSLLLLLLISTLPAVSQEKEETKEKDKDKKWDVNNPPGDYKEIAFTVNTGTWMNLDVSPDGKTVVFDLLGDIYSMPIAGGTAQVLRSGLAYEVQPRFSPDGKRILFTSDAGGGDNIWVMQADGTDAKQITKEDFRLLNNGAWLPDGRYIVARKHFTSERSLGAGEMWVYHISGGDGVQLSKRKNDQQDVNEPSVSSDGRYVYFSEDMYPGGYFQYNKDPNDQIYQIRRYDRQTGETDRVTGGPGGACRPQVSNDGKKLAFVKRIRTKSVLMIHDLETGQEYPIFDGLSKDQQEAWAIFGAYTGFDWTPDDKNIVIWGQGKIWKVDVDAKKATEIPFTVDAKHKLAETVRFRQTVDSDNFEAKVLRQLVTAPDGKTVVFNAVGQLWKASIPDSKPKRLTKDAHLEFEPAFSADGRQLAYVSWQDEALGAIHTLDLKSGKQNKITQEKGIYRTPSFSPDGKWIVYRKEGGNSHQGFIFTKEPGIYKIPVQGGKAELVSKEGEYPRFSADGQKIFYQTGGNLFGSLEKAFKYMDLKTQKEHTVFTGKFAAQYTPSPDNKWIAFSELYKVYIAPLPLHGQPIELSAKTEAIPVSQVARDAGINLHWSGDSNKIHWTLGNEYFTNTLTDRFTFLEGAVDSLPPVDSVGQKIELAMATDKPKGRVAFTGARIVTMEDDQVIKRHFDREWKPDRKCRS